MVQILWVEPAKKYSVIEDFILFIICNWQYTLLSKSLKTKTFYSYKIIIKKLNTKYKYRHEHNDNSLLWKQHAYKCKWLQYNI